MALGGPQPKVTQNIASARIGQAGSNETACDADAEERLKNAQPRTCSITTSRLGEARSAPTTIDANEDQTATSTSISEATQPSGRVSPVTAQLFKHLLTTQGMTVRQATEALLKMIQSNNKEAFVEYMIRMVPNPYCQYRPEELESLTLLASHVVGKVIDVEAKKELPDFSIRAKLMFVPYQQVEYGITRIFDQKGLEPYILKQEDTQAVNFCIALAKSLRYQTSASDREKWVLWKECREDDKKFEKYMIMVLIAIINDQKYLDAIEKLSEIYADSESGRAGSFRYHRSWMLSKQISLVMSFFNKWVTGTFLIRVGLVFYPVANGLESNVTSAGSDNPQTSVAIYDDVDFANGKLADFKAKTGHTCVHTELEFPPGTETIFVACMGFEEYRPFVNLETEKIDPAPVYHTQFHDFDGEY